MTVKELIMELKKYDENLEIKYPGEGEYYDLSEVWERKLKNDFINEHFLVVM